MNKPIETTQKRLLTAMSFRNLKQVDLVNKTGISKVVISGYVNGTFNPKQKNIYLLAQALNISPAWLMGYDVPMELEKENQKKLKSINDIDFSGINRIAAHFEGDEFSEDDLNEIQNFINYVKQKNKNKEK